MTDREKSDTPKVTARRDRRQSPWPLVIVVAVPLLSALLGLPLWVTLVLLLAGAALLAFSPHLAARRVRDPKQAWTLLMIYYTRLQSADAVVKESPDDAAARQRFSKLRDECLSLLNSRQDSDWGQDTSYVVKVRNEIAAMTNPVADEDRSPAPAANEEIGKLVDLKQQSLISDSEFQAFSERFRVLAAEKACGVLETIAGFRLQCSQGTMTEADFHAALQGLLDRLARGDNDATPRPATPA